MSVFSRPGCVVKNQEEKIVANQRRIMAETTYQIIKQETGEVIAKRVKLALDYKSRSIGLLNRKSIDPEEALVIKPCNSIHTFFMKFPIDVLYMNKDNKVVKIVESLKPWRLSNCLFLANYVIEFNANALKKHSIKEGDCLKIK